VNQRPLAAQLIPFAARTYFADRESSGHSRSPPSVFNAETECAHLTFAYLRGRDAEVGTRRFAASVKLNAL
jgi:hypothetical protein